MEDVFFNQCSYWVSYILYKSKMNRIRQRDNFPIETFNLYSVIRCSVSI